MIDPLTLFIVAVFGMIALVCLVSFPLLIYPPYTGPAVPPPGALPAKPNDATKVKAVPLKICQPEEFA